MFKNSGHQFLEAYYVPGNSVRHFICIISALSLSITKVLHLGVFISVLQVRRQLSSLLPFAWEVGNRAKFLPRYILSAPHRLSE